MGIKTGQSPLSSGKYRLAKGFMLSKLRTILWGPRPTDNVERTLLFKQDCFILSYVCLVYWVNYLDRSNLANAYVSGMKEDLNMVGDQYNILNTVFNVGYIVAMIPHNLIMLKIRPRYWLSFCATAWGVLTLSLYKSSSYHMVLVIRFFIAVFESVTFSGTHLVLGSFYEEELLPFRTAIFTSSGLMGSILSSVLQAAIYKHMSGYRGISGWRWLFIIDFLITVPIVIFGFFCFPDLPEVSKPFYFTEAEHQLCLKKRQRRAPVMSTFDWSLIKRIFGSWKWWLFSLLWIMGGENESFATNTLFALWLKYFNYPVPQVNHFPMGIYGVGIFATLASSVYIQCTGGRFHYHISIVITVALIISAILLLANPLSTSSVFVAHYLSGIAYSGQTAFFAWANVVCADDLQLRAVTLASMNALNAAMNAWWSILFYPATDAPKFRNGAIAMICTCVVTSVIAIAIRFLQKRELNMKVGVVDMEQSVDQKRGEMIEVHSTSE